MNKELKYSDLLNIADQEVRVEDDINNYHNQICFVSFDTVINDDDTKWKRLVLGNEDYEFSFDENGNCFDGEFKVYSLD